MSDDYLTLYVRSKSLFLLILSKYSRKCLFFMLLMICRAVDHLPGPELMEQFSNTTGIKIIHQNIRGLFANTVSLTLLLNTYKNIDIVTLPETCIINNSWKDNSGLYSNLVHIYIGILPVKWRRRGRLRLKT